MSPCRSAVTPRCRQLLYPLSPSDGCQTPSPCVQYCQTPQHEHGATDSSARIDLRRGHRRLGRRGRVATHGYPANHFTTGERLRGARRAGRAGRPRRARRTAAARRRAARPRSVVRIRDTLDVSDFRNDSARVGRRRDMRWGRRLKSRSRRRDAMERRSTMDVGGNAFYRVHR